MTEITLPQPIIQEFFRFMARSCVSDELNTYFKFMAVNSIFVAEAKKEVKRRLADNWSRYYRKYMKAQQLAYDMKYYHDALHSKDIYKTDQNHPLAKKAKSAYHQLPLFMPEVNEIYMMLLKMIPELHNHRIPADYFQREKKRYSSFSDYSKDNAREDKDERG